MSICKSSLEKIGKAAFNSLTEADKKKYTTASNIVAIISETIKSGGISTAVNAITPQLAGIGSEIATTAYIMLVNTICKTQASNITDATLCLVEYVKNAIVSLVDQIKHDIANKLAVLFGISENPGILGAIMEFVYKVFVAPVFSVL